MNSLTRQGGAASQEAPGHRLRGAATLICLSLFGGPPAPAQTALCGIPPFPPYGCEFICECDGTLCHWVLICNGSGFPPPYEEDPDE